MRLGSQSGRRWFNSSPDLTEGDLRIALFLYHILYESLVNVKHFVPDK